MYTEGVISFLDVQLLHCGGFAYVLAQERSMESRYRYCRYAAAPDPHGLGSSVPRIAQRDITSSEPA